ncbi:MAG TPA: epoxyqueuosine reductase QueH [Candidatus Aphodousia faecigallinarum]|uniref:Epoxyqueuosine reductase QueH n=1 Tax=Candidatus Aphodousia faecigallinarum TaxID=2840677 RepID=A0A9D1IJE0_9BURK|nr:epoxyqueuosine reductase QueH [Candidatus Aphodousia faecigallinarum]
MTEVLLHCCCAPCSSAILEWLLQNDFKPTLFYFNPNIYSDSEYIIRKNELKRYAQQLQVRVIDGDYDHGQWRQAVRGLENQPERGERCQVCFNYRLAEAARIASKEKIKLFTTTLASSRWKDIEQINRAGKAAEALYPDTQYWDKNWRKGGLQQRRNELLKLNGFYNQLYCGCEFSMRRLTKEDCELILKQTKPQEL